jgi:hypothetical protein
MVGSYSYYDMATTRAVKSFIVQALGLTMPSMLLCSQKGESSFSSKMQIEFCICYSIQKKLSICQTWLGWKMEMQSC